MRMLNHPRMLNLTYPCVTNQDGTDPGKDEAKGQLSKSLMALVLIEMTANNRECVLFGDF